MKDGLHLTIDKLGNFLDNVSTLVENDVLVGVPTDDDDRDDGVGVMNNATLALIHDRGAPEANIPARPFMVPGIENAKSKIASNFKKAGEAQLDGNNGEAIKALHRVGIVATNAIRDKIITGPFQKLADSTLRARKNRKISPRQGEAPLLDTGQMKNAINYVVRDDLNE
jgi:hypothetical protein